MENTRILDQEVRREAQAERSSSLRLSSPEALAEAEIDELKECGLSRYKASYIRGISESVSKGEFNPEGLKGVSSERALEELMRFRGIGRWTAEYVVARGLRGARSRRMTSGSEGPYRSSTAMARVFWEDVREFVRRWDHGRTSRVLSAESVPTQKEAA
ncbi:TPA: hypothetical protein EYP44_03040 [Candidatus Bathyarchaeota archaeon]|nr:hypothetical protein [Candidatus Bathyarchaeota archaeon]